MAITFGGLATGLDTNTIVSELMALERRPLQTLEIDKAWFEKREAAYESFDSTLGSFLTKIENLGSSDDLRQKTVSSSSDENFTVTADTDALVGTNYEIEVVSLAQVQKNVSQGYTDKSANEFGTGELTLTVGAETPVTITIDETNNSLEGIMQAINDADIGVNAAIINDGTADPYRLTLSGENVATTFSLTSSLTGGTYDPFSLTETQAAAQAHIRVDTIDIYSDSNVIDEAIPGLKLDLLSAEVGKTTNISVSLDEGAVKSQIESFVSGYNGVMEFISSQAPSEGTAGGILSGEANINSVKRRLQGLLTTFIENSGSLSALSELGMKTQKDGTLELDSDVLSKAISENMESVEKLLVGEGETEGIAVKFQDYLEGITNSIDGIAAANKKSTEATVSSIDDRMQQMEARLAKREETMRFKFNSLELLISGMNSQSNYLTQQMDMLNSMLTRD